MMKGKVKFYNRKQDFGFVIGADGNEYYFNALSIMQLKEKDSVEFVGENSSRGRVARHIQRGSSSSPSSTGFMLLTGLVIGIFIGLAIWH